MPMRQYALSSTRLVCLSEAQDIRLATLTDSSERDPSKISTSMPVMAEIFWRSEYLSPKRIQSLEKNTRVDGLRQISAAAIVNAACVDPEKAKAVANGLNEGILKFLESFFLGAGMVVYVCEEHLFVINPGMRQYRILWDSFSKDLTKLKFVLPRLERAGL
ncbi:hypothetical protein LTR28_005483 [Elasticomyces elasticus]|nr:hypothetical protein LTR28_005483 [Elasticomyces elasticus]